MTGPAAVIPHGAWIPQADRNGFRHKLGLDETTPLVGIFGFLKPYKRIAESLRAFRRLLRLMPNVKMILVGEPHPEFPVEAMIRSMGLSANVRVLGFTPIEDFVGYLGACDIVLNLRFPTVGESSGTLLRSLGLGKAVMVSEVGSFQEFPDDVCLKVPVGPGEEDLIFEYLNLLVSRPEVARQLGERARDYVARECNWATVAAQYAGFLDAVVRGAEWAATQRTRRSAAHDGDSSTPEGRAPKPPSSICRAGLSSEASAEYLQYASDAPAQDAGNHASRAAGRSRAGDGRLSADHARAAHRSLAMAKSAAAITGNWAAATIARVTSADGETFECEIDHFDAEKDVFPYPDDHFATVICGELIEHLFEDPMHLMSEVNRILKPGGHLVLTTPNIAALRGISGILQGYHPGFFHAYIRPAEGTGEVDARHNREYAPREIHQLLENSGFEVTLLETGEFRDEPHPEFGWILHLLERYRLSTELRGDGIYAVGRKTGAVRERYPAWLYYMNVAYLAPDVRLDAGTRTLHATFDSPQRFARNLAAQRRLRRGLPPLRCGHRHADCGRRARASRAGREAGRDGAGIAWTIPLPGEDGRYQVLLSPMRENVCWYYEQGWPFLLVETSTENGAARVDRVRVATRATLGAGARGARHRAGVRLSGLDGVAQSRPDPRDGAARHSGAVSRQFRRRILDHHQSAAADADLLLRVRRGAARPLRSQRHAGRASRSTSWRACCRGWRSARPPDARRE